MSWGSGAASSGSAAAGSAGGNAGGFSIEPATTASNAAPAQSAAGGSVYTPKEGVPNDVTSVQGALEQAKIDQANQANYDANGLEGPAEPSMWSKAVDGLERFQKGGDASIGDAWKNRGFNAETAGYLYNKVNQVAGAGKQAPASPINTTINYQQPTNPYLEKRRRY